VIDARDILNAFFHPALGIVVVLSILIVFSFCRPPKN